MDVIKTLLTLSDFVTPCLWQLTLKYRLRLLWFTTTDSQMTGLLTLRKQSDFARRNGLIWWLHYLQYEHFNCVHYKNS